MSIGAFTADENGGLHFMSSPGLNKFSDDGQTAVIHAGDAAVKTCELKQQQGKDIVLWGSLSLAHALIRENLIDEYQIRICPAILGRGMPLSPADFAMEKSKHAGTKPIRSISGCVLACLYRPQCCAS